MNRSLIALATLTLATTSVPAQTVCWDAGSSVLPHDVVIPAQHRFGVIDEESQLSLVGDVMRVVDATELGGVILDRTAINPIAMGDEWEFVIEIKMTASNRTWGVPLGCFSTVADELRAYHLGVDDTGVGFVDTPSDRWVEDLFFPMDVSDQLHHFRVVASVNDINLYIDGSMTPSITIPKTSFPASSGIRQLILLGTSLAATAEFDVARYHFSRINHGLALSACAPVVSPADNLRFSAVDGQPGSAFAVFVSSINGSPFSTMLFINSFAADSTWNLTVPVPGGLSGLEVGLVLYGFDQTSRLTATEKTFVAFQ